MKLISGKTLKCLVCIFLITSGTSLLAEFKKTYEGKVVEIAEEEGKGALKTSAYLKYPGKSGAWVLWIIQPGVFVKEGTLLVHTDPTFVLIDIEKAKARVQTQALILNEAKNDMERCRNLIEKNSVSAEEKEAAEKTYYNAVLQYEYAKKDLKEGELNLEYVDIKAPYDCYIDKAYAKVASSSDIDFPVLKILRLSPLYIEVKLDRALAKKIYNQEIGVSVYPAGDDKPVGIFNEKVILTENGIRLPVRNYIIDENDNKKMPLIHDIEYVSAFKTGDPATTSNELGIFENSLYNDSKGTYVWKAVGQKALQPGKTIDSVFSVEKIYVHKTDIKREGFDGKLYKITNTNKLQVNDVLLKNAPNELKDGDKVVYEKIKCLFWPGDKVKVVLN
jgi:hypothetical protein